MIDHLDMQTNEFLENGTRGDFIPDGYSVRANEDARLLQRAYNYRMSALIEGGKLWDSITTPVNSIFAESPLEEPEPIVRPATVPKKKEKSLVSIKPNQFISYQAIEDFCNKVEGL